MSSKARNAPTCAGVGLLCGHLRDFAPLASEVLFLVAECALLKEARRAVYASIAAMIAELFLYYSLFNRSTQPLKHMCIDSKNVEGLIIQQ